MWAGQRSRQRDEAMAVVGRRTRSSSKEMKMTLKTRFRVLGSTDGAMFLAMGDHGRSRAGDKMVRRTECDDTINVWARPGSQRQSK